MSEKPYPITYHTEFHNPGVTKERKYSVYLAESSLEELNNG